ncbi:MAG: hypothetical protein WKG01_36110 [Kofleriaceae bacterium]
MSVSRIVVFALALTHVVGLAELVMEDRCGDVCEQDGCDRDCLPGAACRCHTTSAVPLLQVTPVPLAKRDSRRVVGPGDAADRIHANPDPREILHVPRRAG